MWVWLVLVLAQAATPDFAMEDIPAAIAVVVLCGLIVFAGSGGFRRRKRPAPEPAAPAAPTPPSRDAPRPVPTGPSSEVVPVERWLPLLFDLSAHIVILAGSGSGKTRTARGLVRYIVERRRERVIIFDPKANSDTWMGLPAIVKAAAIEWAMRELLGEFQRRLDLNPTYTEAEADTAFERIWIVVDEVSFIKDNCRMWIGFLRRISSMARSLKMHLIIVNQSERVDELGLKGRGDLLANFSKIYLTQSGWQGAPARVELGELSLAGAWLSYFPNAYQGSALPVSAIFRPEPARRAEPAEPVPAHEDGPELVPVGGSQPSGTGGTSSEVAQITIAELLAQVEELAPIGETEAEKICRLAGQGWSRNQIADEIGGRRVAALARIREALDTEP
jgi:hypothetical protein